MTQLTEVIISNRKGLFFFCSFCLLGSAFISVDFLARPIIMVCNSMPTREPPQRVEVRDMSRSFARSLSTYYQVEESDKSMDEYRFNTALSKSVIDKVLNEIDEAPEDEFGRKQRLPTTILVGERKTGTTALLFFLGHHPQIKAPTKEVHFFDHNFDKGLLWYAQQMELTRESEVTFEKSPSYFRIPYVARRIKVVMPDVKLLLCVKDPIKRAISDYHFSKRADWIAGFNRTKFDTFEEYALDTADKSINANFRPIEHSLYSESLKNWLQYFSMDQILIVNGDNFVLNNPADEMKKIEKFMNLKPYFTKDMFFFKKNKGFWCLKDPGCIGFGGKEHPALSDEVVAKLKDYYQPYNEEFYNLTGRHFAW